MRHVRRHRCQRSSLILHPYQRPRRAIRQGCQRSPPPANMAPLTLTRWALLPEANRHRLLYLLGRLVERQLPQAAGDPCRCGEEGPHDADTYAQ